MMPAATNSSTPMPIWIAPARPARHEAGAQPRARDRGADHQHQRRHLDLDDGDEDERLRRRSGWCGRRSASPGCASSSTTWPSLYSDVVVANEPIPSVSKKSVTAPIDQLHGVGQPVPLRRARAGTRTPTNATVDRRRARRTRPPSRSSPWILTPEPAARASINFGGPDQRSVRPARVRRRARQRLRAQGRFENRRRGRRRPRQATQP